MKSFLIVALLLVSATVSWGQYFEGKVVYQNTYKSKLPDVTDAQFTSMMGSTQTYLIKGGNYRSNLNGTLVTWQLYINRENKLYTKTSNSETILWDDAGTRTDSIVNVEIRRGVTEIAGQKCDEVTLTLTKGVEKYYFNPTFGVDTSLYSRHLFGNWYDYLKHAKAIPLKMVIENPLFSVTSVATEIKAMKLNDEDFRLPENSKTAKRPS